jgi:hypothetical protein
MEREKKRGLIKEHSMEASVMKRIRFQGRDEPILLREAAFPGALSGLSAAGVMAAVLMFFSYRHGDLWQPMKLIAATVLGEKAVGTAGFQPLPVLIGMAIHLSVGVVLGIFFVWLAGFISIAAAIGWGINFGLAVWVIMQFGLLPVVNPWMAALPLIPFALAHGLFGLVLGSYPRFMPLEAVQVPQVWRKAA